jgi:tungstate transport system substrate-binding protein
LRILGSCLVTGLLLVVPPVASARAAESEIVLASTTSTEGSGLFALILPKFEARSGIRVQAVATGTGQALRMARRGDADVLLVHDRASEEAFVREGYGVERHEVMYNDFVLVGPAADPAGVRGGDDVALAFRQIADRHAPFVSRGDDSGTHKAELRIWQAAGIDPRPASGTWYRETGSGQGASLNTSAALGAYAISDRGSWLAFKNRGKLEVLLEGDERLHNAYGVILVNRARHPHVRAVAGQAFIDWLLSAEGQAAIGSLRVDGRQLFTPSARTPGSGSDTTRDRRSPARASAGSP